VLLTQAYPYPDFSGPQYSTCPGGADRSKSPCGTTVLVIFRPARPNASKTLGMAWSRTVVAFIEKIVAELDDMVSNVFVGVFLADKIRESVEKIAIHTYALPRPL
jgi:hypothetical protein